MSWGTVQAVGPVAEIDTLLQAAADEYTAKMDELGFTLAAEVKDQIAAGVTAGVAIAKSGAAGEYVRVQMSGHANPEHKPVPGWSNDSLNLYVWGTEPEIVPTEITPVEAGTAAALAVSS